MVSNALYEYNTTIFDHYDQNLTHFAELIDEKPKTKISKTRNFPKKNRKIPPTAGKNQVQQAFFSRFF